MKIAKGSASWVISPAVTACMFLFLSFIPFLKTRLFFLTAAAFSFVFTAFLFIFFRDPDRVPGRGVVGCADGKIREIKKTHDEDIGDCLKISTFMNVYNVHVNRMPLNGVVSDIRHLPGGYVPAFKKESDRNERMILTLETEIGVVKIVQIAGALARRIVTYVKKGDRVKKGERIGMIRLGSRVDVYLPVDRIKKVFVKPGDKIKAGSDTIAEINN